MRAASTFDAVVCNFVSRLGGGLVKAGLFCLLCLPTAALSAEQTVGERVRVLCQSAEAADQLAAEEIPALVAKCTLLLGEIATDESDIGSRLISEVEGCRDALRQHLDRDSEFQRLCARVDGAQELSAQELQVLIVDCDWLLEQFADPQGGQAKVRVFRLRKCRNFFVYSLELLEAGNST